MINNISLPTSVKFTGTESVKSNPQGITINQPGSDTVSFTSKKADNVSLLDEIANWSTNQQGKILIKLEKVGEFNEFRRKNENYIPKFPLIDLSNKRLNHIILSEANFERADLKGTWLNDANLKSVNLEGANLEGAKLIRTWLSHSNLKNANLKNALLWETSLMYSNLESANLENANLGKAILAGANFENANLEKTSLIGAELWDASLKNVDLKGASLVDAILKNTNLVGAILDGAQFTASELDVITDESKSYIDKNYIRKDIGDGVVELQAKP